MHTIHTWYQTCNNYYKFSNDNHVGLDLNHCSEQLKNLAIRIVDIIKHLVRLIADKFYTSNVQEKPLSDSIIKKRPVRIIGVDSKLTSPTPETITTFSDRISVFSMTTPDEELTAAFQISNPSTEKKSRSLQSEIMHTDSLEASFCNPYTARRTGCKEIYWTIVNQTMISNEEPVNQGLMKFIAFYFAILFCNKEKEVQDKLNNNEIDYFAQKLLKYFDAVQQWDRFAPLSINQLDGCNALPDHFKGFGFDKNGITITAISQDNSDEIISFLSIEQEGVKPFVLLESSNHILLVYALSSFTAIIVDPYNSIMRQTKITNLSSILPQEFQGSLSIYEGKIAKG